MSKTSMFVLVIIIILTLVLFIIPQFGTHDIIEGIRGGGGGRRRGGGGRRYRGRGGRRWYGGNIGYSYRPPLVAYGPRYIPWWTTAYWFTGECKDGCTNIGNNNWGCQYPGYGYNDCMFARDCMGCGI